jgi:muramidase (phage lysozyme)
MTPEIESRVWAAFQRVIMFAEGTWYRGSPHNGYLIMYTGKNIRDILPNFQYEKHPYFLVPANRRSSVIPCGLIKGRRVCSWASGIGQFMPDTWTEFWHKYPKVWFQSIPEFGAQNQDRMIQILAGECGAYWALMRGVAIAAGKAEVNRDNLRTAIVKASPTWAGLPNWLDESALDQNAKPMAELERLFYRELNDLQRAV